MWLLSIAPDTTCGSMGVKTKKFSLLTRLTSIPRGASFSSFFAQ